MDTSNKQSIANLEEEEWESFDAKTYQRNSSRRCPWNSGSRGGYVNNQGDGHYPAIQPNNRSAEFAYLMTGLGIGVVVSMILAPRPGAETRLRIANRVLNSIEATNEKVRRTRLHMTDIMDHGQQRISAVVDAGREAVSKLKTVAN